MTTNTGSVYLIACSKTKNDHETPASEMYTSTLFVKSMQHAKFQDGNVAILSAKYGLLLPDDFIEPYNETLSDMKKAERVAWAKKVYSSLIEKFGKSTYIFLAGKNYYQPLVKLMEDDDISYIILMEGMGIGQRLQFLKNQQSKMETII